jgi:cobalt-zinc-cadmium efflux system outer membrane protein
MNLGAIMTALVMSGPGPALQVAPAPARSTVPVSLDEALRLGELHSPLVRRARADKQVVAARDVGASLILTSNPVVSGVAGPRRETRATGTERGLQFVARLEQTVEVAGQRGARREVVRRALDAASAREALARSENRARIRSAYIGGLIAAAQAQMARGRETIVRRLQDAVKIRVEKGAASQIDLKLAEIESARLARERVAADAAAAESTAALAAFIGFPPRTEITLTTPLSGPTVQLPPEAQLLADARARRAELRELQATGSTLDAELVALRREALPSPTVIVEVERDLPGQLFVGAGLALPLPAWQRNQGPRAIVSARRDRVAEELLLQERAVALEVEQGFRRVVSTFEQAKILETKVAPVSEANAELLTDGWRAGKFDLFRVIQASRDVGDARRAQLEAIRDFWQAVIELDRATGAI